MKISNYITGLYRTVLGKQYVFHARNFLFKKYRLTPPPWRLNGAPPPLTGIFHISLVDMYTCVTVCMRACVCALLGAWAYQPVYLLFSFKFALVRHCHSLVTYCYS